MNTIQTNAHVVLEYTLKDEDGDLLDASNAEDGEPMVYVHGYGLLVPGLEAALEGLEVGTEKNIVVDPSEGFGEHDEELVDEIDRNEFPDPKKIEEGDEFVAETSSGEPVVMRVVEVRKDSVVVDANHPLAGVTLHYWVKVTEVREASKEEIQAAIDTVEEAEHGACCGHDHDHDHHHHGHEGHEHGHHHHEHAHGDHSHAHAHTHGPSDGKKLN